MSIEIIDLRKGERFTFVEPVSGTFGAAEVVLLDLSLGGLQVSHAQPLRIGTRGKISFRRDDVAVVTTGHVVWSHFERNAAGMIYKSGIALDAPDPHYALAINTFVRSGIIRQDTGSLERKRQRLMEREEARKSQVRVIPSSEPPPA